MALANAGAAGVKLDWPLGTADDLYIEFMTALVTPPAIGGNLLGVLKFEDYKRELPRGAQAIFVASNGPYDFLGTKYFRGVRGQPLRSPARGSRREDFWLRAKRLFLCHAHPGAASYRAVRAAGQFRLRSSEAVATGNFDQ